MLKKILIGLSLNLLFVLTVCAGSIIGTVTDMQGNPIENAYVKAYEWNGSNLFLIDSVNTGNAGTYTIQGLATDNYYLQFGEQQGFYQSEGYHNEVPFYSYSIDNKTAVSVVTGQVTSDIDEQLELGGKISGQVTDFDGNPISGISVNAHQWNGSSFIWKSSVYTNSAGNYTFNQLLPSDYYLTFSILGDAYFPQGYPNDVPNQSNSIDNKTAVSVTVNQITENIDVQMALTGEITGMVTDAANNSLEQVVVAVYQWDNNHLYYFKAVNTDSSGNYSINGLDTGDYYLKFSEPEHAYFEEGYHDEIPFVGNSIANKAAISVVRGQVTSNINEQLEKSGQISGLVTDASNNPIAQIAVTAYQWDGSELTIASYSNTDENGIYTVQGLTTGTYYLLFSNNDYYYEGYSDEIPFDFNSIGSKAPIQVISGQSTNNINEQLTATGKITGLVSDTDGTALVNMSVSVYQWNGERLNNLNHWVRTDQNGQYEISQLLTGDYYLLFSDPNNKHLSKGYANESSFTLTSTTNGSPFDLNSLANKTAVSVISSQVTSDINIQLQEGGAITGKVTDLDNNPIDRAWVGAYKWSGSDLYLVASDYSNNSGDYEIEGLESADYYLQFGSSEYYYSEGYHDELPFDYSSINNKTPVSVQVGQLVADINEQLESKGKINGLVTDLNGVPLQDISVRALVWDGNFFQGYRSAMTDSSGHYSIAGLEVDNYYIRFNDTNKIHITEGYADERPFRDAIGDKTSVSIARGQIVSDINAQLAVGGSITGTIQDLAGNPLADVYITAYLWNGTRLEGQQFATSDSNGNYSISGLSNGNFYLHFYDNQNIYADAGYHNEIPYQSNISNKTPVAVIPGQTTNGINQQMEKKGKITGKITDSADNPLQGISIQVFNSDMSSVWTGTTTYTDSDGNYTVSGLDPGIHYLGFLDDNGIYISEGYSGEVPLERNSVGSKTPIQVSNEEIIQGIDTKLDLAGEISGQVVDMQDNPLNGIRVEAYAWDGNNFILRNSSTSDNSGNYHIKGLATGNFYLNFIDHNYLYLGEAYHNELPFNFSHIDNKTAVAVIAGQVTENINEQLQEGGIVTGQISNNQSVPLEDIQVQALSWNGSYFDYLNSAITDNSGHYTLKGLASGQYYLKFFEANYPTHPTYLAEGYHNEVPFSNNSIAAKTPISVLAGQTLNGIDEQLSRAGKISGQVSNAQGLGLTNISIVAYAWNGQNLFYNHSTNTDSDGNYTLAGLEENDYYLVFTDNQNRYMQESYHDDYIIDLTRIDDKQSVRAIPEQEVTGIDEQLVLGAEITGIVTDTQGAPISNISVVASIREKGRFIYKKAIGTAADGTYRLGGLTPGSYYLRFTDNDKDYISKGYPDEVPLDWDEVGSKIAVELVAGQIVSNVNMQLRLRGQISGSVSNKQGSALENIQVDTCRWLFSSFNNTMYFSCSNATFTDSSGNYLIDKLEPGSYYVKFGDYSAFDYLESAYLTESPFEWNSIEGKTSVDVIPGQTTQNQNVELMEAGQIAGRVTNQSLDSIAYIKVSACLWEDNKFRCVKSTGTDSSGEYVLKGLGTGQYYLVVNGIYGFTRTDYVEQAYGGEVPFNWGSNTNKAVVSLLAGESIDGIDIHLQLGGYISGQITNMQSLALGDIWASACVWKGTSFDCSKRALSDSYGNYHIGPLKPGDYYLWFGDDSNTQYTQEGYPDENPFEPDNIGLKQAVTVVASQITSGIDEQLDIAANIVVVSASSILETAEVVTSVDFEVFLNKQPTDNVNLLVSSSDVSEGITNTTNLEFTPSDWNIAQTIRVTGVDDSILDGAQKFQIDFKQFSSNDPHYNNLNTRHIPVVNSDNEVGGDFSSFVNQANLSLSSRVVSNVLKVNGIIDGSRIKVVGGEYSINNGKWLTRTDSIKNGDYIMVRHQSSSAYSSVVETMLTISDTNYVFGSMTQAAPVSSGGGSSSGAGAGGGVSDDPPTKPPTSGGKESTTVDGVEVVNDTVEVDGKVYDSYTVEPIVGSRTEDDSTGSSLADIPLLGNQNSGQNPQLIARLPIGIGLKATGSKQPQNTNEAIDEFKTFVQAINPENKNAESEMVIAGQSFIEGISTKNDLVVSHIQLNTVDNKRPGQPIVIEGMPSIDNFVEVVLIDASQLPPGTVIELKDVEFAIIVGAVEVTGGEGPNIVYAGSGSQYIVLGEDNDELHGGEGDDTVGSKGGDDIIFGDEGNDSVFGGTGDDFVHGGAGKDTAIYSDELDQYSIVQYHAVISVISKQDNSNKDTLVNVESLSFGDDLLELKYDQKLIKIATFYQQVFSRQPDLAGFQYWAERTSQENSLKSIALSFLWSVEAIELYNVNLATADNSSAVNFAYQALLQRLPDSNGKAYWVSRLEKGDSVEAIVEDIMYSSEFESYYSQEEEWNFIDDGSYRSNRLKGDELN